MGRRPARGVWWVALGGMACGLVLGGIGCALIPPNSFLDPTKVGRFGLDAHEGGIRRILTPRDTPPGLAGATEPTPEDVLPNYEEYRLTAGDGVGVSIQDLLAPGNPYSAVIEVSPLGEIRLPEVGAVRVAGLTEHEAEQEIAARLKDGGILPRPVVQVFTQQRRGRIFSILGAVGQPGPYPIPDPDFRLLDAFGLAGDVSAVAKKAYVIRRTSTAGAFVPGAERTPWERLPAPPAEPLVVPPSEDFAPQGGLSTDVGLAAGEQPEPSPPQTPEQRELQEVIAPGPASPASATKGAAGARPGLEPIIFDPQTGELLEAKPGATAVAPPEAPPLPPATALPPPDIRQLEQPFDWANVPEPPLTQRVISIDVGELKNGNPRFNIVLRNRDVINIPADTGVFYVVGEVQRPGVYAFGGRDITIKQAMAIVGGFTPLAWPGRCEVIRREPGTDKQLTITVNLDAIYAGLEDDFFLRDDDIINVGTHIVAPFLFVIRNSFRFTYGFGFVYDRNFADRDSYGSKINPEIIDQQRRAQRGLPF